MPDRQKPLEKRAGCLWDVPGRGPYKGTVRQVLTGATVPEEVISKIDSMVIRGRKTGRVEIMSRGIWTEDGRRHFDSTVVAMGFGNPLCYNTKVKFHPGHDRTPDAVLQWQLDGFDEVAAKRSEGNALFREIQASQKLFAERAVRWDRDTVADRRPVYSHYFGPKAATKKPGTV